MGAMASQIASNSTIVQAIAQANSKECTKSLGTTGPFIWPLMWKTFPCHDVLTHWGRMTHICVGKITIMGPDNGLSPGRRQAIIWTNAGTLLIGPSGTNFSEILIEIITFSFKKIRLKVSSAKRRPFCLGLNVLMYLYLLPVVLSSSIPLALTTFFIVLETFHTLK